MNNVDNRAVRMEFDNKQFEKNIADTMGSLDKLKGKLDFSGIEQSTKKIDSVAETLKDDLDFSGVGKGLEDFNSMANSFSFDGIAGAVDTIANKFSWLGMIGFETMQRITSAAVDAGIKLVKSLSVDNIVAGWEKFGEKTTSVATLVSQGYSMEEVIDQLERLNWFTDETSYNFTDMVSNIAKFTASGQDLETSVTAMEGIANWAALSGQKAATASRAMYQLSQAMSAGIMRKEDYKSIQNASMDTQEFRQHVLDAAVALGTLQKNADGTYLSLVNSANGAFNINQFADHLTEDAWFTTDVMMAVYQEYAGAVDQIYEYVQNATEEITASQAIEELGGQVDAFGLKAFKAAQEARTWGDVVDSVKDAVGTQWLTAFESIFGTYEEAKTLWTNMANELYDVFTEDLWALNDVLSTWGDAGGRTDIFGYDEAREEYGAMWNFLHSIVDIVGVVKESLADIFIPEEPAKVLKNFTENLDAFSKKLIPTEETLNNVHRILTGLMSVFLPIKDVLKAAAGLIGDVFFGVTESSGGFLEFAARIGDAILAFNTFLHESSALAYTMTALKAVLSPIYAVISGIGKILAWVAGIISEVKEKISEAKDETDGTESKVSKIVKVLIKFRNAMSDVTEWINNFVDKITKINLDDLINRFSFFKKLFGNKDTAFEEQLDGVTRAADNGSKYLKFFADIVDSIRTSFEKMIDFSSGNVVDNIVKAFDSIFEIIGSIGKGAFGSIGQAILDVMDKTIWSFMENHLGPEAYDVAFAVFNPIYNAVKNFFVNIALALGNFGELIDKYIVLPFENFKNQNDSVLAGILGSIGGFITFVLDEIALVIKAITGLDLTGVFSNVTVAMNKFIKKVSGIGKTFKTGFSDKITSVFSNTRKEAEDTGKIFKRGDPLGIGKVGNVVRPVADEIRKLEDVSDGTSKSLSGMFGAIKSTSLSEFITNNLVTPFEEAGGGISGVVSVIVNAVTGIVATISTAFSSAKELLQGAVDWIADMFAPNLSDSVTRISGTIDDLNSDSKLGVFGKIGDALKDFGNKIKTFYEENIGPKFAEAFESIKNSIKDGTVFEKIAGFINGVGSVIGAVVDTIKIVVGKLVELVDGTLENAFGEGYSIVDVIMSVLSGGLLITLANALSAVKDPIESITDLIGSIQVEEKAEAIFKIAEGIAIIAGAVLLLSFVKPEKLLASTTAIAAIMLVLQNLMKTMSSVLKGGIGDIKKGGTLDAIGIFVIEFAAAVLLLSAALKNLGDMDTDALSEASLAIVTIMLTMTYITKNLAANTKGLELGGIASALVSFGIAVKKIAKAMAIVSEIPADKLKPSANAIKTIIAELGLVFKLITKNGMSGNGMSLVAGFISFASAIQMLVIAVAELMGVFVLGGLTDTNVALAALGGVAGLIVVFGLIYKAIVNSSGAGSSIETVLGFIAFAGAIQSLVIAMIPVMTMFAIDAERATQAMLGVALLIVLLGAVMIGLNNIANGTGPAISTIAAMVVLAGVVVELAGVVAVLAALPLQPDAIIGAILVIVAAAAIMVISLSVLSDVKVNTSVIFGLIVIAGAVAALAAAMIAITSVFAISPDQAPLALMGVIAMMIALAAGVKYLDNVKVDVGTIVALLAVALVMKELVTQLLAIVAVVQALGEDALGKFAIAIGAMALIAAILVGFLYLLGLPAVAAGATTLQVIAASFLMFSVAIAAVGAGAKMLAEAVALFLILGQPALELVKTLIETIIGYIPAIIAAIGQGLIDLLVLLGEQIPLICDLALKLIETFLQTLLDEIPTIGVQLVGIIIAVLVILEESTTEIATLLFEIVWDLLLGLWLSLTEKNQEICDAAADWVISLINAAGNTIRNKYQALHDAVFNFISAVTEVILRALTDFGTDVKKLAQQIMESEFVQGLKSKIAEVKAGIKEVIDGAIDKIKSTWQDFKDAAKHVIDGLIGGIKDKLTAVWETSKEIGQKLLNGVKDFLGIESPSKVMRDQVGKFVDLGLAAGVTKYSGAVEAAGETVGNDLQTSLTDALNVAYESMQNTGELDPTIRPVVDLSNVNASANAMNGMFASRSLSLAAEGGLTINAQGSMLDILGEQVRANQNGTAELVRELESVKADILSLGNDIREMRIVMDGDALVGHILKRIDAGLGKMTTYKGRAN